MSIFSAILAALIAAGGARLTAHRDGSTVILDAAGLPRDTSVEVEVDRLHLKIATTGSCALHFDSDGWVVFVTRSGSVLAKSSTFH